MPQPKALLRVFLSTLILWLMTWPVWAGPPEVNAVLGDISYVQRFGVQPDSQSDEKLRIQTHLAYVEQLLRQHIPSSIPPSLYPRRRALLDLLRGYHERGIFPSQSAYAGRRPHFIDAQGRHCAVGYLIARSGERELAREINRQYAYAYLPEMDSPKLARWVAESGFTAEELAMIQPSYYTNEQRAVQDGFEVHQAGFFWISSAALIVFSAMHFIALLFPPENYAETQWVDLALTLGLHSLVLGIAFAPQPYGHPMLSSAAGFQFLAVYYGLILLLPANIAAIAVLPSLSSSSETEGIQVGYLAARDLPSTWGISYGLSF